MWDKKHVGKHKVSVEVGLKRTQWLCPCWWWGPCPGPCPWWRGCRRRQALHCGSKKIKQMINARIENRFLILMATSIFWERIYRSWWTTSGQCCWQTAESKHIFILTVEFNGLGWGVFISDCNKMRMPRSTDHCPSSLSLGVNTKLTDWFRGLSVAWQYCPDHLQITRVWKGSVIVGVALVDWIAMVGW